MYSRTAAAQARPTLNLDTFDPDRKRIYNAYSMEFKARPGRAKILTQQGNFPTDLYVAGGVADLLGLRVEAVPSDSIIGAIDADVAAVLLTHVDYTSGAVLDMRAINRAVAAAGALCVWDLSHSAGAIAVDLNGQKIQEGNTSLMIHDVFEQIVYASNIMTLHVGDVIATGTPPGVGFARKPPVFLKHGDEMEVEIEKIGTLNNPVRNAAGEGISKTA